MAAPTLDKSREILKGQPICGGLARVHFPAHFHGFGPTAQIPCHRKYDVMIVCVQDGYGLKPQRVSGWPRSSTPSSPRCAS